MSRVFDCDDPDERARGLEQAAHAARRGELVVLPTDTVYGLGCRRVRRGTACAALLAAKGRGRDMPVPVLVGSPRTPRRADAPTCASVARDLVEAFWPGGLTVVSGRRPRCRGTSVTPAAPWRCGCRCTRWPSSC